MLAAALFVFAVRQRYIYEIFIFYIFETPSERVVWCTCFCCLLLVKTLDVTDGMFICRVCRAKLLIPLYCTPAAPAAFSALTTVAQYSDGVTLPLLPSRHLGGVEAGDCNQDDPKPVQPTDNIFRPH